MTPKLSEVRAAIGKARGYEDPTFIQETDYSLADVLLAMQGNRAAPIGISINGDFLNCDDDCNYYYEMGYSWNLAKDDLSLQSPATIDFLHSILCSV